MNSLLRGLARGAPFLIIAGLIGAVFLARLDPRVAAVEPPALHPRDHFVAIASPQPDLLWMVGLEGKIVSSGDGGASRTSPRGRRPRPWWSGMPEPFCAPTTPAAPGVRSLRPWKVRCVCCTSPATQPDACGSSAK